MGLDSLYGVTVKVAAVGPDDGEEMFPEVAVIIVCWFDVTLVAAVNKPVLLIVPALVLEELQVALDVMFSVAPEAVAVAVNCMVLPWVIVELVGVTAIEVMFPS